MFLKCQLIFFQKKICFFSKGIQQKEWNFQLEGGSGKAIIIYDRVGFQEKDRLNS